MQGSYLSAAIRVELEGAGARYLLAPRRVGWVRHFGWALVGLGAAAGIGVVSIASRFAIPLLDNGLPTGGSADSIATWIGLAAVALGCLIGLSIAFRVLRFGLFIVAGRSEVHLSEGRLIGIERGGPLRRSRRTRASEVRLLRVTDALRGAGAMSAPGRPEAVVVPLLARLEAVLDSGRTLALAVGYPAEELELLARDLAERIPSSIALSGGAMAPAPGVERVDRGAVDAGTPPSSETGRTSTRLAAERLERADAERARNPPEGSPIEVERTGGGLIVRIPPAGLLRGSHGLFAFGVVWTAMVLLFATFVVLAGFNDGEGGDLGSLGALGILSLFAVIGFALLWFGARAGTRRTRLELAPPLLRIASVALGGEREETLEVRELRAIAVGPSGVRVNNRDIPELKLHRSGRRTQGLLRERRPEELDWLAALLRAELDLPAEPGRAPSGGSGAEA